MSAFDVNRFAGQVKQAWAELSVMAKPREPETEDLFIYPVVQALGWSYLTQQTPGQGRRDIPDALLFLTVQDREAALKMDA